MTPWWGKVINERKFVPLPAEESALKRFAGENPGAAATGLAEVPVGFWRSLSNPLPSLDFSDWMVIVRDDLPEDIAYLLTWCLIETRDSIEAAYAHIPPEKSPLSYPLVPSKMAQTPIPLHSGARKYYTEAGYL
jgi:TRAP-type uncharacterized transport system substrate-binding protein